MGKKNKIRYLKGLTIQFIPYSEIENLKSESRIKKLLDIVIENKIIILQGKLKSEEEARLIEDTMVMAGHVANFRGIELATINPNGKNLSFLGQVKHSLAKMLGAQESLTIVGPASIVKEIKRDPRKIELMMR
jgi:hypothetical protein